MSATGALVESRHWDFIMRINRVAKVPLVVVGRQSVIGSIIWTLVLVPSHCNGARFAGV